jgi:SAM-dependent methyltransferase
MKQLKKVLWLAGILAIAPAPACASEKPAPAATAGSAYTFGAPSRDGIGKFYMGREISHVMGHLGAGWLERDSRDGEERTALLIEKLPLNATSVVVDLGAGTGYFSVPMAKRVTDGRVLAVDLQPEMLAMIEARQSEEGLTNIKTVLASETDPNLPASSVDLVLIVDAYHEFAYPLEVMQQVAGSLKPDGRLYLIEYRGEDPSVPIKPLHKMTEEQAKREMNAAGLSWVETQEFLPRQHVLIFKRSG